MRENFWSFRPTWKIGLCTYYKPTVRGTDFGIWRRIKLVPFDRVFKGAAQDKAIAEKLCGVGRHSRLGRQGVSRLASQRTWRTARR